jgi:hypothetical protein
MKLAGVAVLLWFVVSAEGVAQDRGFASKGTVEVGGNLSFSSFTSVTEGTSGEATTMFTVAPRVGYFVVQGFELGIQPGASFLVWPAGFNVVTGGGSSTTLLQVYGFAAYNVKVQDGKAFLFLEAPAGYATTSGNGSTRSGFSWGARGGVKIVPTGGLLVTIAGEYYQVTLNRSGASSRSGFDFFSVGVGLAGFF